MRKIRQHIPGFVEGVIPTVAEFDTLEELLAVQFVEGASQIDRFSHFALSENTLMAIYKDGAEWWVVGYIDETDGLALPEWEYPMVKGAKYR